MGSDAVPPVVPAEGLSAIPPARRQSLKGLLARVVILVTLIPFLPLAYLTWVGHRTEVRSVEDEIQASNRHIASLAAGYLDTLLKRMDQTAGHYALQPGGRVPRPDLFEEVLWEVLGADSIVIASQVDGDRVGATSAAATVIEALAPGESSLSRVDRWIPGRPPTVLLAVRSATSMEALVGVLVPEILHARLHAWSGEALDRHVYTVDGTGELIFYSDLAVSSRGEDLRSNPPIRLILDGGQGELRYRSTVSGKDRLGAVQLLEEADWAVIVSADAGSRLLAARDRSLALAWSIGFALLAAIAILTWTTRRLVSPILDIRRGLRSAERAPHAPLDVRSTTRTITEYDELVQAFDELAGELAATERELVHAEKASLLGQLASGLAHEMGTPLNVITGDAQYLLRKTEEGDAARPLLQQIVGQTERIAAMIRRLLDLSRPARAQLVPLDPGEILRRTLDLLRSPGDRIEVRIEVEPGVPQVLADPKLLEHALLNLAVNAVQAMPDGGVLTLGAGVGDAADRMTGHVRLRVGDTGSGILPEHLDRVFEPFFTTKPPDQGTGLGLPIVERIVRQHGGRLAVHSEPGKGAEFSIYLRSALDRDASGACDGRRDEH